MAAKLMLKSYLDIDVIVVHSGEDAVEKFKNNTINLVLMDIGLGAGINGAEATKIIRDFEIESGRERCHIYALTAHADASDIEYQASMGIDRTFKKPLSTEIFHEIIENTPILIPLVKEKPSY